jgi:hypothetical protein
VNEPFFFNPKKPITRSFVTAVVTLAAVTETLLPQLTLQPLDACTGFAGSTPVYGRIPPEARCELLKVHVYEAGSDATFETTW